MHDAKVGILANHEGKVYNDTGAFANLNFLSITISHLSKSLETPPNMRGVYCDGASIQLRVICPNRLRSKEKRFSESGSQGSATRIFNCRAAT